MRYLSHTEQDINSMLQEVGKPNIDSLFDSIPKSAKFDKFKNKSTSFWSSNSELELSKKLEQKSNHNISLSFLGAGATQHFVPQMVSQQLLRSEWYTAYTPYQPEVAQGTLQAIFEFQTMVASLYGCNIANASMYDGATALAEALLMAARIKHKKNKNKFLISKAVHPEYRAVCQTFLESAGLELIEVDINSSGQTDLDDLENKIKNNLDSLAAVAYQTPNFLGLLEEQQDLIKLAQDNNILAIAANSEPLAFGLFEAPGSLGADIVVGEGIGFCGHLSLGAPGVGLFACKEKYVRQMPGRLVGESLDEDNNRAFVLTLATREQHIRRERATSNICTNHSLMALAFSMSLSLYGKNGFKQLAEQNFANSNCLKSKLKNKLKFRKTNFNEVVLEFESEQVLDQKLKSLEQQNIFGGVKLSQFYPEFSNCLLVCTTEFHTLQDLDLLIGSLGA